MLVCRRFSWCLMSPIKRHISRRSRRWRPAGSVRGRGHKDVLRITVSGKHSALLWMSWPKVWGVIVAAMWKNCHSDLRRGTVIPSTKRRSEQQAGATKSLQIKLRDGVVLVFLVNLQSTPLTVDDEDSVPFLVIAHSRGIAETPFTLQALHAATHFHHIGVSIEGLLPPFRHDLGIPNEGGDQITVGSINTQLMVGPITY